MLLRTSLNSLYNSTDGDSWKNNTNWLVKDTSICDWYGVTCAGKWVQKLDLSSNDLGGPLPNEWERAPYLDTIDLSSNQILGTIPPSLGNLSLNSLLLSGNSLKGTIPTSLAATRAKNLFLGYNQLTGTLPSVLAMTSLQELQLDDNKLSGSIPAAFGALGEQLLVISASFNDFEGEFPSGLCLADFCYFENTNLECPSDVETCKCSIPRCNCGDVCSSSSDCSGGKCDSCSRNSIGVSTCGGK